MPSSSFTFRIPEELREKLEQEAKKDGRSLSNLVIKILNEYISRKEKCEEDV